MTLHYRAAFQWQSRAVLGRHLTVYRSNWYTAALPPLFEPIILLLAFGVVSAILSARTTGKGQVIDCAMPDGAVILSAMTYGLFAHGMWNQQL